MACVPVRVLVLLLLAGAACVAPRLNPDEVAIDAAAEGDDAVVAQPDGPVDGPGEDLARAETAVLPEGGLTPADADAPDTLPTCGAGTHPCGGKCADDRSPATCGTSCEPCPTIKGGEATCEGKCGGRCPPGFKLCLGECIAEGRSCAGMCGAGTHDCQGVCADNKSVNSCGATSCSPCQAPPGGRATCDGDRCDFVCETGRRCTPTATTCTTGCCTSADCTSPGKVGTCNTANGTCSFACDGQSRTCGNDCIPRTACCDDCPGDFACNAGTCSTSQCRIGYKRCGTGCVPQTACCPGAEQCFNGADDDCDNAIDCADADCGATAMCVPAPAASFALGVRVETSEACPTGYTASQQIVNRDLEAPPTCTGCSCRSEPTRCRPVARAKQNQGDGCSSGPEVGTFIDQGNNCVTYSGPPFDGVTIDWYEPVTVCEPTAPGSRGTRAPAYWQKSYKFCERVPTATGGGCSSGQVCVQRTAAKACVLAAGTGSCPAPYISTSNWYAGFSDTRQCTTCQCAKTPGSCPSPPDDQESSKTFFNSSCSQSGPYRYHFGDPPGGYCSNQQTEASVVYLGTPVQGMCSLQPSTVTQGAATPTDRQAFCCLP